MTYYALVCYPEINTEKIEKLRRKYDPTFNLMAPHITIIFPVPASIGKMNLTKHIKQVLARWRPFNAHIAGLKKSWDNWLFLILEKGSLDFVRLHDELYSGPLFKYLRKDIKYAPHIGLGLFIKEGVKYDLNNPEKIQLDSGKYEQALQEAKKANLNYEIKVRKLQLIKLNNTYTKCNIVEEFLL